MAVMECLHTAAWHHTTLRNKDRIFDSTFPTLPGKRGLGPRTDESSWTSHIKPHTHLVTSIRGRPGRPTSMTMTILDFAWDNRQATHLASPSLHGQPALLLSLKSRYQNGVFSPHVHRHRSKARNPLSNLPRPLRLPTMSHGVHQARQASHLVGGKDGSDGNSKKYG